jgi:hypothetical protein
MSQYGAPEKKPAVNAVYEALLQTGMTQKDAAKEAQKRTGMSVVTGRPIVKKVEFSSIGNVSYAGQYPSPKR